MDLSVEYIGYIAMTLLVISFVPRRITMVRAINLFGCIFFVIYGILLGLKWPIIISNGLIAFVQLYHLFIHKSKTVHNKE